MNTQQLDLVEIRADDAVLPGDLQVPAAATGLVIFAHGSGSSRFSVRNRQVAAYLNSQKLGTLLLDLLTPAEELIDVKTGSFRFDTAMLGRRVASAVDWARNDRLVSRLPVGCFGASTGAAAALIAAAARPDDVRAVVSRGGRPDLAAAALPVVQAPTLLIVGGRDTEVIALNRRAMASMRSVVEMHIVPGATHLFEERGALEEVQRAAGEWFARYLTS